MKVIDPGHVYDLDWLDGQPLAYTVDRPTPVDMQVGMTAEVRRTFYENRLIFVKREGEKYPGNVGHHPGTNMQEVLRALIDRVKYVDGQRPHDMNEHVIYHMRAAMFYLEKRAAELHGREWQGSSGTSIPPFIESFQTCKKCGHIGCDENPVVGVEWRDR